MVFIISTVELHCCYKWVPFAEKLSRFLEPEDNLETRNLFWLKSCFPTLILCCSRSRWQSSDAGISQIEAACMLVSIPNRLTSCDQTTHARQTKLTKSPSCRAKDRHTFVSQLFCLSANEITAQWTSLCFLLHCMHARPANTRAPENNMSSEGNLRQRTAWNITGYDCLFMHDRPEQYVIFFLLASHSWTKAWVQNICVHNVCEYLRHPSSCSWPSSNSRRLGRVLLNCSDHLLGARSAHSVAGVLTDESRSQSLKSWRCTQVIQITPLHVVVRCVDILSWFQLWFQDFRISGSVVWIFLQTW